MSSGEFPVSNLYLTPRAIETAQAARVIAFDGNGQHLHGIYDMLSRRMPECLPAHTRLENILFVARWVGWSGMAADQQYNYAPPDAPYLAAAEYSSLYTGQDRTTENGWTTKEALSADPQKTVVELKMESWRRPWFGVRVTTALTPHEASRETVHYEANGELIAGDPRVKARREALEQFPDPFSVLRMPRRSSRKIPTDIVDRYPKNK